MKVLTIVLFVAVILGCVLAHPDDAYGRETVGKQALLDHLSKGLDAVKSVRKLVKFLKQLASLSARVVLAGLNAGTKSDNQVLIWYSFISQEKALIEELVELIAYVLGKVAGDSLLNAKAAAQ